ncbi:hypothetical protein GCM10010273_11400 [Streptomyces lavendulocolor]
MPGPSARPPGAKKVLQYGGIRPKAATTRPSNASTIIVVAQFLPAVEFSDDIPVPLLTPPRTAPAGHPPEPRSRVPALPLVDRAPSLGAATAAGSGSRKPARGRGRGLADTSRSPGVRGRTGAPTAVFTPTRAIGE